MIIKFEKKYFDLIERRNNFTKEGKLFFDEDSNNYMKLCEY